MKEKIEEKLDELLELLDQEPKIVAYQEKKKALLHHPDFLEKMKQFKSLDTYTKEYQSLKKELFQNPDFREYKQLENEIDLFLLEMNQRFQVFVKKGERSCELSVENIKEEK